MKIRFKLPHKIEQRNRVVGLLVGVFLSMVFSLLYVAGPLKGFDNTDLDLKFKARDKVSLWKTAGKVPINDDILMVLIDDDTLDWEGTFPDDPLYYNDIVDAMGKHKIGALAVMFDIEYSRPFGRKVDPNEGLDFQSEMEQVAGVLGNSGAVKSQYLDQVSYFNEVLDTPEGRAAAKDIATRLNEMVFSEDLTNLTMLMDQVSAYASMKTNLGALSPDREKLLNIAQEPADNTYFIYEGKKVVPCKYRSDDLINKAGPRKLLGKILGYHTLNRPENPAEGLVFDAYMNMSPEDMKRLLAEAKGSFSPAAVKRIEQDYEERKNQEEEFIRQASRASFSLPKDPKAAARLRRAYPKLRQAKPLHPLVAEHSAGMGIARPEFSSGDGTVRMIAPAYIFKDKIYPHIDMLLAARYLGVKDNDIVFEPNRIVLKNAVHPRTKKKGDVVIPLLKGGAMLVNWGGIWADTTVFDRENLRNLYVSVKRIAYYDMYSDFVSIPEEMQAQYWEGLPPEKQKDLQIAQQVAETMTDEEYKKIKGDLGKMKGRILIVGRTAVGSAETNPTPLEPRYHIIGLHANAINTIIENIFIRKTPASLVIVIYFAMAVSLGFLGGLLHLKSAITTAMLNFFIMSVVGVAYGLASNYVFARYQIDMPIISPIILIVITFLMVFLYRFMTEEAEKKKMKNMFSTYVNKEVVDTLIQDPDKLKLGGEWMNCTVFFSDVAGFTSISESLKPEELVELLNEYLTAMTDIIFSYGGTLDKYIGDAIVAVYGAPIPFDDHAIRACRATIDMQKKLAEMRDVWKEQGRHQLTARCGVHTGPMIAGNVGSVSRFNYTVMGENVDFGEHLESGGKNWNTMMSIGEVTREQAGDKIITRMVDIDNLKGYPKPIRIYELVAKAEDGISDNVKQGIAIFEKALELYFHRKWDEAIETVNGVFAHIPDDPPSTKLIERCEKAKKSPPGDSFDEMWEKGHAPMPAKAE